MPQPAGLATRKPFTSTAKPKTSRCTESISTFTPNSRVATLRAIDAAITSRANQPMAASAATETTQMIAMRRTGWLVVMARRLVRAPDCGQCSKESTRGRVWGSLIRKPIQDLARRLVRATDHGAFSGTRSNRMPNGRNQCTCIDWLAQVIVAAGF